MYPEFLWIKQHMVCVSLSSRHDALWKLENQSSCLFYLLKFIPWSIVFFVGKGRSSAEVEVDLGASMTSLVAQTVKQLSTMGETWVWKSPWRRKWQPTPVLLPWKSHGQRSLVQASIHGVAKSRAWLSDFTFFSLLLAKLWESLSTRGWGLLLSDISGHQ